MKWWSDVRTEFSQDADTLVASFLRLLSQIVRLSLTAYALH